MTFGIRSFIRFGKDFSPLAHLVLYLQKSVYSTHYLNSFRGKPAIYELVGLHPYHKSSKDFFNVNWFGPPAGVTPAFNLLMVSSFVFGSNSYN